MIFDIRATSVKILVAAYFLTTVAAFAGWTVDHHYNTIIETSDNGDIEFHFNDPNIKLKDLKFKKINHLSEIRDVETILRKAGDNFTGSSIYGNVLCTENKKQGSYSLWNSNFIDQFQFSYPRYQISSTSQPNIDFHARDSLFFNDLAFWKYNGETRIRTYATTNNLKITMNTENTALESKAVEQLIEDLRINNLIATETPTRLQSSLQILQVLESYGVPWVVLMKYGPKGLDKLPYFLTPEKDMEAIISELASELDFTTSPDDEDAAINFINKVQSYVSEKSGSIPLFDQVRKVGFPINYVLSKALGKRSESLSGAARGQAIDVALMLVSVDANTLGWYQRGEMPEGRTMEEMNHLIDKQRDNLIRKLLSHFIESGEGNSTILNPTILTQDLITRFQAKLAGIKLKSDTRPWTKEIPFAYYFALHALQFKEHPDQLLLAKHFLELVKPTDKNPAFPNLNLYQDAQNTLARLNSEQVHHDYAHAKTDQEKCQVIERYLNLVQGVPSFSQTVLNNTVSKLAFGPWDEGSQTPHQLDFDLDLSAKSSCARLLFHWSKQTKANAGLQGHTPVSVHENPIHGKTLASEIAQAIHLLAQANQENQKLAESSSAQSNCDKE